MISGAHVMIFTRDRSPTEPSFARDRDPCIDSGGGWLISAPADESGSTAETATTSINSSDVR